MMIDRAEIRRRIAAHAPEKSLKASAADAAYEAVLAAQEAGAPGSVRAGLLVAYAEEWKAMQAELAELARV